MSHLSPNIAQRHKLPSINKVFERNNSHLGKQLERHLKETKFKISIEAGSSDCWKKYLGDNGIAFGIDEFGKSAPYKDIYKYFGLESTNIKNITKKLLNK